MRTWIILGGSLGLVALIAFFDRFTGIRAPLTLLYLGPVAIATWFGSRPVGLIVALTAASTCLLDVRHGAAFSPWRYVDTSLRAGVLLTFVLLLSALNTRKHWLRQAVLTRTRELRREVKERQRVEAEALKALEAQKNEIADQLHDGLAQSLSALAVKCRHLEEELRASYSPSTSLASEITKSLNDAVDQSRKVARGLSIMEIDANEIVGALERLVAESERLHGLICSFTTNCPSLVVGGEVGLQFYLIVQQAIDNAIRHGGARLISVDLQNNDSELRLSISDNGTGFDPALQGQQGLGLRLMRFRARLLGGTLTITSEAGKGARIEMVTTLGAVTQDPVEAPKGVLQPQSEI